MLVTRIEEILEILPTARWKDPTKLFGYIEDVENSVILPILGDELLDSVQEKYDELMNEYGLITAKTFPVKDQKKEDVSYVRLIKQIQKVLVFRMMADNATVLSASFNEGGGFNRMASDNYNELSLDEIKAVKSEYWHKSITATDVLLLILEKDALSEEPLWKESWKQSDWYFQHSDLIFSTLRSITQYYPMQKSEQRIEFMEILPEIRYCQNTYILPMLGVDLLDTLLEEKTDVAKKSLQLVRVALGIYIRARVVRTPPHSQKERQYQLEDLQCSAKQALQTAMQYMQDHAEELTPAIESAQFYKPPRHPHPNPAPADSEASASGVSPAGSAADGSAVCTPSPMPDACPSGPHHSGEAGTEHKRYHTFLTLL